MDIKIKCPRCSGINTEITDILQTHIWDEDYYKRKIHLVGEKEKISKSSDNVIFRCFCAPCEKYFTAMVKMQITAENIITSCSKLDDELKDMY